MNKCVTPVVRDEMVGVSHVADRGKNGGVGDENRGNLTRRTLLLSRSDRIPLASAQDEG